MLPLDRYIFEDEHEELNKQEVCYGDRNEPSFFGPGSVSGLLYITQLNRKTRLS